MKERSRQRLTTEEMMFLARGLYLGTVWEIDLREQLDPATNFVLRMVAMREPETLNMLDETATFGEQEMASFNGLRIPRIVHFVAAEDARTVFQAAGAAIAIRGSRITLPIKLVQIMTEAFVDEIIIQLVCDDFADQIRQPELVAG